eukprot:TRINITY_DN3938_c0_g4_i2.p1 TRINITY_DN3938_c0_g4~~TRINITY_DN3938_c0_g4_i2.p1  ORF type:complete len:361 (-),score=76.09 TRINITY_DN3938_c0_g4_i2:24-1106(-)
MSVNHAHDKLLTIKFKLYHKLAIRGREDVCKDVVAALSSAWVYPKFKTRNIKGSLIMSFEDDVGQPSSLALQQMFSLIFQKLGECGFQYRQSFQVSQSMFIFFMFAPETVNTTGSTFFLKLNPLVVVGGPSSLNEYIEEVKRRYGRSSFPSQPKGTMQVAAFLVVLDQLGYRQVAYGGEIYCGNGYFYETPREFLSSSIDWDSLDPLVLCSTWGSSWKFITSEPEQARVRSCFTEAFHQIDPGDATFNAAGDEIAVKNMWNHHLSRSKFCRLIEELHANNYRCMGGGWFIEGYGHAAYLAHIPKIQLENQLEKQLEIQVEIQVEHPHAFCICLDNDQRILVWEATHEIIQVPSIQKNVDP